MDLPEGTYTLTACDDVANARNTVRNDPNLSSPTTVEQVLEAIDVQMKARRTNLVLRIPVEASGVAVSGKSLPHLPGSMVHIFANSKRTGAQTMSGSLVARTPTEWVIQGSEAVRITVSKHHRVIRDD
jgi:hypothetical protein